MTSSEVTGVDTSGKHSKVTVKTKKGEETLECDVVPIRRIAAQQISQCAFGKLDQNQQ